MTALHKTGLYDIVSILEKTEAMNCELFKSLERSAYNIIVIIDTH